VKEECHLGRTLAWVREELAELVDDGDPMATTEAIVKAIK
jgi:hypothetical protein